MRASTTHSPIIACNLAKRVSNVQQQQQQQQLNYYYAAHVNSANNNNNNKCSNNNNYVYYDSFAASFSHRFFVFILISVSSRRVQFSYSFSFPFACFASLTVNGGKQLQADPSRSYIKRYRRRERERGGSMQCSLILDLAENRSSRSC